MTAIKRAKRKTQRRRKTKTQRRSKTQTRRQRRSLRKAQSMKGGVDTPSFGDESIIEETNSETHLLDDSDITPPFETDETNYGETTSESVSNNSSLAFGGGGKKRKTRRRRGRGGGFTITEDVNPPAYNDDYEKNLANMEEIMFSS
jgi:hypothetical protein